MSPSSGLKKPRIPSITLDRLASSQFPMGLWAVVLAKVALHIQKCTRIALIASTLCGVGSLALLLFIPTLRHTIYKRIVVDLGMKAMSSELDALPPSAEPYLPDYNPGVLPRRK